MSRYTYHGWNNVDEILEADRKRKGKARQGNWNPEDGWDEIEDEDEQFA